MMQYKGNGKHTKIQMKSDDDLFIGQTIYFKYSNIIMFLNISGAFEL